MPSRKETYGYNPTFQFVFSVTNALGQTNYTEDDARWGVPTIKRNFDGTVVTFKYDDFGSLRQTNLPAGYSTSKTLSWDTWNAYAFGMNASRYFEKITDPASGETTIGFNIYGQQVYLYKDIWNLNGQLQKSYTGNTYDSAGRKLTGVTPHLSLEGYQIESIV